MSHVEHKAHNGGTTGLLGVLAATHGKVAVGFIKGKTKPQREPPKEGEKEEGPALAQVAAWNVYGTPTIPERNFFRIGLDNGRMTFRRLNRVNLLLILRKQMTIERALGQLGGIAAGELKKAIATSKSWAVPNAPSTIAKKTVDGKVGDQPLKDTGNMEQGVTWEVRL